MIRSTLRLKLLMALCGAGLLLASCGSDDNKRPLGAGDLGNQLPGPGDPGSGDPGGESTDPPGSRVDLPSPSGTGGSLEGTFLDVGDFPKSAIQSGGPLKDGIPALTNPTVSGPDGVTYLQEDDLVLGVVVGGEARAYPHNIGWWHEIVNDAPGGIPISVTFCPLTGTGLVFDAMDDDGGQFELGVSGLLFNNNLIMYDRRDGTTLYPQIAHRAVEGPRAGETLKLMPVVETTWSTWKQLYPDTRVVAEGTYSLSRYSSYPYGDYRTNHDWLLFSLTTGLSANGNPFAALFGAKDRVLGVRLDGEARAYPLESMGDRQVINEELGGVDIVVVWDREHHLAIPYAREVDGQSLTFDFDGETSRGIPFSLRDRETGSLWDITGRAVDGPLAGKALTQVPAHSAMWFSWVTFWQNTSVWQ